MRRPAVASPFGGILQAGCTHPQNFFSQWLNNDGLQKFVQKHSSRKKFSAAGKQPPIAALPPYGIL